VVIGGLFTATLLTLVVLPVLYVLWYKDNRVAKAEETRHILVNRWGYDDFSLFLSA
jgi:hypothetical protein